MLKRNRVSIIILLVLGLVAGYFFFFSKTNTFKKNEADFTISDLREISKIEIVYKKDSVVTITRSDGFWLVNDLYKANPEMMKLCFKIFSDVEIKSVLPKKESGKMQEVMQKFGSVVKVYESGSLIKEYRILSHPQTKTIYMMLAQSRKPYMVKLPSFEGNFAALFKMPAKAWRDNSLVRLVPAQITAVQVEYADKPNQSFELMVSQSKKVQLRKLKEKDFSPVTVEAAEVYLMGFRNVQLQGYIYDRPKMADSLLKSKPICSINILDRKGTITQFSTFSKSLNKSGSVDPNLCYVLINSKDVAIAKYVELDPITRTLDFFNKQP